MSRPYQASSRVTFDPQGKLREFLEVMSSNNGGVGGSNGDALPEPNKADLGNVDRAVAEPPLLGQHSRFLSPPHPAHRRPLVSNIFTTNTRPRSGLKADSSPINETIAAGGATQPIAGPSTPSVDLDSVAYTGYGLSPIENKTCFARRARTLSPDDFRRSSSKLKRVPESEELDSEVPLASDRRSMEPDSPAGYYGTEERFPEHRYYGSVGQAQTTSQTDGVRYSGRASIEFAEGEDLDEEEEELVLDEELAKEGLYRGDYKIMLLLYTFVPFTAILTFIFLALLPSFAYCDRWASYFPYPLYLPFPLPELITATALWSLAYLLPDPLYAASQLFTSLLPLPSVVPILTSLLAAFLQTTATLIIRLLAIPILLIPYYSSDNQGLPSEVSLFHYYPTWHDDAFRRVWWVALGWAATEAVVGIKQGYESIALYKDVLVSVYRTSPGKEEVGSQPPANRTGEDERTDGLLNPMNLLRPTSVRDQEVHDVDATATQRNWGNRDNAPGPSQGRDVSWQRAASTSSYRHYSASLSSISTSMVADDLSNSAIFLRGGPQSAPLGSERRPLLSDLSLSRVATNQSDSALAQDVVERDLEELMTLKTREEMEEIYGMPVIQIPVFISCLHRINSILSCVGVYLLLSAAFMRSRFAYVRPGSPSSDSTYGPLSIFFNLRPVTAVTHPHPPSNRLLLVTFFSLLLIQTFMAFMHTPWILPAIGIHTFVYVGLLVSLGLFFGGLGVWEALT